MEFFACSSILAAQGHVEPIFSHLKSKIFNLKHLGPKKILDVLSSEFQLKLLSLLRISKLLRKPFSDFNLEIDAARKIIITWEQALDDMKANESTSTTEHLDFCTTESKKVMQQIIQLRTIRGDYERLKTNVIRALPPSDEFDAITFLVDAYSRLLHIDPFATSDLGKEMWKEGTFSPKFY